MLITFSIVFTNNNGRFNPSPPIKTKVNVCHQNNTKTKTLLAEKNNNLINVL